MRIKRFFQLLLGRVLNAPVIPPGKTVGYSLVRSEKIDTVLGESTSITPPFILRRVSLGKYSYIAKNSNISNCVIGKFCSIGPNFCCGLGIHPTNGVSTSPMFYSTARQNGVSLCKNDKTEEFKQTIIGNDVFIGANVIVLDGVTIGDGSIVGAGAVVNKDVPPYAIVAGVPAAIKRYRFDEKTIDSLLRIRWWDDETKLPSVEKYFFDVPAFIQTEDS